MAAYAIQFRRGTTTQHNSFTGLLGEVTVDTDKKTLVVHDGSTTGGFPLAREGAASSASSGSFTSNVNIGGTLAVTSTASFTDDVSITGDLDMTGHIIPSANITYDLGSPTMMWRDIYVGPGSLYVNGKKVIEDNNGSINFTTDANETLKLVVPGATGTLQFSAGSLQLDGEINAITGDITFGDHLDMSSNRIKNISAPVEGTDATNKTYVDNAISSGLSGGSLAVDATTGNFSGDVTVGGSLTVTGTVTTVNSETIELADNILLLNSNTLGNASQSGGIEVERGDDLNVQLLWDETNDRWSVGSEDFKAATFIGNLTGDVTGTVSSIANHDSDDLSEGTANRFYTTTRQLAMEAYVDSAIGNLNNTVNNLSSDSITDDSGNTRITINNSGQILTVVNSVPYNVHAGGVSESFVSFSPAGGNINSITLGNSNAPWSKGYFNDVVVNSAPTISTHAANKSYVDSVVAAGAYSDSDLVDYLANNQTFFDNIRRSDASATVGTWADPFNQVNGQHLILTESIMWPSAAAEHGSYKLVEIKGQTGTGTIHAEFFPDVIKPGYSTGGDDVKLEPNAGGVVNVSNSKISNVSTPTNATDAANKSYVDSVIAAGEYGDSDVKTYLEAYDGNINLDATKAISYKDFQNTSRDIITVTEAGGSAIGAAIRATYFTQIDPNNDFIISTGTKNARFNLNSGHMSLGNSQIKYVGTPTDTKDAATKEYVDSADTALGGRLDVIEGTGTGSVAKALVDAKAYADQAEADAITSATNLVANATGSNLSLANKSTSDLSEGSNQYFTDARAVAAVESALTHFHSAEQVVSAAVATSNASGSVSFTFSELAGADHYAVYLNRQLLRPGEFTANANSTNNLTISTGILAEDDELEVVGFKL